MILLSQAIDSRVQTLELFESCIDCRVLLLLRVWGVKTCRQSALCLQDFFGAWLASHLIYMIQYPPKHFLVWAEYCVPLVSSALLHSRKTCCGLNAWHKKGRHQKFFGHCVYSPSLVFLMRSTIGNAWCFNAFLPKGYHASWLLLCIPFSISYSLPSSYLFLMNWTLNKIILILWKGTHLVVLNSRRN